MSGWDVFWGGFLAAFAVIFGVAEGVALKRRHPGDTLSETLRRWLFATRAGRRLSFAAWAAFVAWFTYHLWWD